MNLQLFFRVLRDLSVSSCVCIQMAFMNYVNFRDKIEEVLTTKSRESIKTDPLAEMVLGSMIGSILFIPHFNLFCGVVSVLIVLISFAQIMRVPIHGCLYASLLFVIGGVGFVLKSFLYFSGSESSIVLMLPIVVYMIASIIFYAFRCLDEGVALVIKKDFYEIVKLVLFGILIKLT